MKNRNTEIIVAIIGWLLLIILIYFLYHYFFFQFEFNGYSFTKNLLISLGIAATIAFIGFFPLMGLPGGIILFSLSPLLGFSEKNTSGDKAWPAAIMTSLFWPFSLPVGLLVKVQLLDSPYHEYANHGWIIAVLVGMLFSVFVVNLMGKKGL